VVDGAVHRARVRALRWTGDRVTGVTLEDGTDLTATTTVLAAGASIRFIDGLPDALRPPVRPVKGQTLRVRLPDPLPRIVRGSVKGNPVYLVPRTNGELVIGATSEEVGFDVRPRAGAVYELLRDAQTLVPSVAEAELVDVSTGLRPGSPDNAPIIGRLCDGLVAATGHYRNGVLLTPVTADGVAQLVVSGQLPAELQPFRPQRFTAEVPA
jgi:glycine oxidase